MENGGFVHRGYIYKAKAWIGIDPGVSKATPGAAALVHERGHELFDWTSEKEVAYNFRKWVSKYNIQMVAIERQWGRRGNSIQNINKLMKNYGTWIGIVLAHELEYTDPTPDNWQRRIVYKLKGQDIQKAYTAIARTIFPNADLRLAKHHGRASALLIADYCKSRYSMKLRRIQ